MTNSNTTDWTVLQLDGVNDIAHRAAVKVATTFRGVIDYDDLHQDAAVILASNPATVRGYINRNQLGFLYHWLWCDLTTVARREATKKNRQVSYEETLGRAA